MGLTENVGAAVSRPKKCMIATGNHRYFDSLRDAPRSET